MMVGVDPLPVVMQVLATLDVDAIGTVLVFRQEFAREECR
jgi:hypothetical protein